MSKLIKKYSEFVCRHPYVVVMIVVIISILSVYFAGTIEMKTSSNRDFLPKDEPAIKTLFMIEDEFGSTNIVYIALELDTQYLNSNEIRDIRHPLVLKYIDNIGKLSLHTDGVIEANSASILIKNINNGTLPNSLREVEELTYKNGLFDNYISKDNTMSLIRIKTTDDVELDSLEIELEKIIRETQKPSGVSVSLGGTVLEQQVMKKHIQPDMQKTSTYSLIGIMMVVLFLFRSIKYGFTPLTTIIFGSLWAMGYVGLIGMGLSSATSGVLSMIMGIGIDFGIQVVTRYRYELIDKAPIYAMESTLTNVIIPMSTTTLAALIGFQALLLGKLTFMGEMGIMMSYGVAASMIAAITIVPAIIIIFDTINIKKYMVKKLWKN